MCGPGNLSTQRVRYIYVSRFCYLLIFVSGILGMMSYIMIVYMSVVAHECAHLVACFKLKIKTEGISFFPYGANLKISNIVPPAKQILISVSGPLCSLVFFLAGKILSRFIINEYILFFTSVNFTLFMFNMLPCIPLDGGEILRSLIGLFAGIITSYRLVTYISCFFEMIFLILGIFILVNTGENITLIVISAIILTNILKMRNTVIYTTGKILTNSIKSDKKIKLIVKHKNESMHKIIKHISFGYTIVIAVYDGERYIGFITQKQLLYYIKFYQTFGECVENIKKVYYNI